MERLNRNIGSTECPLQHAPEVLDSVRVDFAAYILFHVIHGLMNESLDRLAVVTLCGIGIDRSSLGDLFQNLAL